MRYAILNSGNIVENVILADADFAADKPWLIQSDTVNIGDKYENGNFITAEDQKTLDQVKAEKNSQLAAFRYEKEIAGVVFDGNTYDTSRDSQSKYIAVYVLASSDPNYTVNWKTKDGNFVELNSAEVIALAQAVQDHVQNAFNTEKNYINTIDACTTKNQVKSIDITQGW